jgi:hypothetical protein
MSGVANVDSRETVEAAMQTPDGAWRVEIVLRRTYGARGATQSRWYRVVHHDDVRDWLSINEVQRILTEAGVDMADLTEIPT